MNPKLFFALVGLLVLIFLVGTGAGMLDNAGQQQTFRIPDWGERIRGALEQSLSASDVKAAFPAACREQMQQGRFVLEAGKTCTLVIDTSKANVRTLTLMLEQGAAADVVLVPQGEGRLTARETLEDESDEVSVDVFKEGGTLEISCTGDTTCRLAVQ
jgi:hypothetical protein